MLVILLNSLWILSIKKINYKILKNIMVMFILIIFIILYQNMIDQYIIIFLWNYNIKLDFFTINLKLIILIFFFNYLLLINKFFDYEKIYLKEFILLIFIAVLGSFFILMSNEFFMLYLAIELQNLILYVIASCRRLRSYSIEAGIKYYIMGSFSSGILLYGIILLFGLMGTLNFI